MPYEAISKKTGKTFYLHAKDITLRNTGGRGYKIHYFASEIGPNAVDQLPEGHEVYEHKHTGTLFLQKTKKWVNE